MHFNPAVTLAFAARREIEAPAAALYVLAQIAGGIVGTVITHAMLELPLLQLSATFPPADELAKFAVLRDRGIISADEFDQKKRAILGL
ncbi:aquaporin [Ensifer sp. B1-9]|uniref:SHOCT domain-containing protein n=1 Tax=Ensifer sp. B1-9 TaxID=3141455 RepID=UPI003D237C75